MATTLRSGSWLNDNREIFAVYVTHALSDGTGDVMVDVSSVEAMEQVNPTMTRLHMRSGQDHEIAGTIQEFIDSTLV